MIKSQYKITTDSDEYETWPWYLEYLGLERSPSRARMKSRSGKVPIEVGVQFARWIMETPELRDVIYRRFVLGDYDNETEKMHLTIAPRYFFLKCEEVESSAFLSVTWHQIARVLDGQMDSVESHEFREAISPLSKIFDLTGDSHIEEKFYV